MIESLERQASMSLEPTRKSSCQQKIAAANLDAIFVSSTVPETYSYTLSSALRTDLPIVVFDIGAPARRVKGVQGTVVLPLALARQPGILNSRLLEWLRSESLPHHSG